MRLPHAPACTGTVTDTTVPPRLGSSRSVELAMTHAVCGPDPSWVKAGRGRPAHLRVAASRLDIAHCECVLHGWPRPSPHDEDASPIRRSGPAEDSHHLDSPDNRLVEGVEHRWGSSTPPPRSARCTRGRRLAALQRTCCTPCNRLARNAASIAPRGPASATTIRSRSRSVDSAAATAAGVSAATSATRSLR